ncbi:MAG: hypothetical protein Q8P20_02400 [bacterium]|nr:hypothetical protein [bacterium]
MDEPNINNQNKNINNNQHSKNKIRPIVGPIILIIIGLVFLLNSMGIELPWAYVWPILIIVVGILMIFGRGVISGGVITLLIIIIVFAVLFSLLNTGFLDNLDVNFDNLSAKKLDTTTTKLDVAIKDYDDVDQIDLNVDIGIGEYSLTSVENEDYLFMSEGRYNYETFEPVLNKNFSSNKLTLDYTTKDVISLFGFSNAVSEYNLNMGQPKIKTNFDLNIGTGQSNIKLTDQQIGDLKLHVGTGEMEFDADGVNKISTTGDVSIGTGKLVLSGLLNASITNLDAEVGTGKLDLIYNGITESKEFNFDLDLGTGTVNIELPSNIGFKISPSVGTGKIEIENKKIDDEEDYISENYSTAETTLNLNLDIGTGAVYVDLQNN